MELGKNISKIRKDNNLTQDDLASKYFVTRQTISNWENGKTYPDLETLVKLSNDFNISLDVLLKEDEKMVKEIDNKVKATKKYKNILKYVFIVVCVLAFFVYKAIMLNEYQCSREDIGTNMIFNETINVSKEEYNGERLTVDNMSLANYFDGYVDTKVESSYKVKYDKNDQVVAFYGIGSLSQYVNVLSKESFELSTDDSSDKSFATSDSTRKYLNSHNIKNDIDLLRYIKENYYFENNIFTLTETMKNNYLLNSFISIGFLQFRDIVLINGNIEGYIVTAKNSGANEIKEIHILKDDKQYIMTLCGSDITNDEFITKLLSTVEFS